LDKAELTALARGLAIGLVKHRDEIDGACMMMIGRTLDEASLLAAGRLALDMIERGDVK